MRLGRGEHRRDADVLPTSAAASQTSEVDQHAGADQPGAEAADVGGPDLPNAASCLRLIRALAVEIHEDWVEATRYLNMEVLKEQLKEAASRTGLGGLSRAGK